MTTLCHGYGLELELDLAGLNCGELVELGGEAVEALHLVDQHRRKPGTDLALEGLHRSPQNGQWRTQLVTEVLHEAPSELGRATYQPDVGEEDYRSAAADGEGVYLPQTARVLDHDRSGIVAGGRRLDRANRVGIAQDLQKVGSESDALDAAKTPRHPIDEPDLELRAHHQEPVAEARRQVLEELGGASPLGLTRGRCVTKRSQSTLRLVGVLDLEVAHHLAQWGRHRTPGQPFQHRHGQRPQPDGQPDRPSAPARSPDKQEREQRQAREDRHQEVAASLHG